MSRIEWTDETWNPVTGCTRISEGCERCYIERTPPMRMAHRRFDGPQIGATTGVRLHPERLRRPVDWRKPRKVFVCSMADLFHDDVPDEFISRVFATMAVTEQHTFQVLTKRTARMRALLSSDRFRAYPFWLSDVWPLPNVWIGTSVESQKWADIRIPLLLDTPAAVRWISAEPLLGWVDLDKHLFPHRCPDGCRCRRPDDGDRHECACGGACADWSPRPALDWVVVGGESGPGARPMDPDWARDLRDQCIEAGVPFLFKQWGEHVTVDQMPEDTFRSWDSEYGTSGYGRDRQWRVGKRAAGRELDERTWDQYPEGPAREVVLGGE
ncbi:putative bacteriophage protein [Nocardia nova SH22a]|uniref:Putative bacteriophage protein n=1 Tax=Nocardia nova SH22a TaxID=1415166 RepID=W5TBM3_9NOCA|nr:phage Gp37/Gp68 family protein [Nocardia nova]AHH16559.1 putative bacteriophage protein [Nocardia nova SH22a]